ncbi:MAG: hypothetical protein KIY10_08750 [Thermoplasmata archaeon]|nr:hypothetical protein [Candidatus Sysuiplasma jiujiangense]MBX8640156.1 hypothetical protein [Candidatus Sysuiplasma jiujiangense]MBX8642649.1 hypothetical protein [Candidatus Sysuiplasma jiujiangense]
MKKQVRIFLAFSILFMIVGLLDGVFRLMARENIRTSVFTGIYGFHPLLVVFGFIAVIIMTERVASFTTLESISARRRSMLSLMVPFTVLGTLLVTTGISLSSVLLSYSGVLFLLLGSTLFIATLKLLSGLSNMKTSFRFMILSGIDLWASELLSPVFGVTYPVGYDMLLLSFPVIFIIGERIELTRFISQGYSENRFKTSLALYAMSAALFMLSLPFSVVEYRYMLVAAGIILMAIGTASVYGTERRNLNILSRSAMPLQRYVSMHTRIAYAWLFLGLILSLIYLLSFGSVDTHDVFIHSIAVGFVLTMILAHGPIIMPTVAGRRLKTDRFSPVPLLLLTAGNAVRVGGGIVQLFASIPINGILVGLSGWPVFAALIIFLLEVMMRSEKSVRNGTKDTAKGQADIQP